MARPGPGRVIHLRWAFVLVGFLGTLLWLRVDVVDTVTVTSGSMMPTICTGDRLLIWQSDAAEVGDLVTFLDPVDHAATLKRVVAVAGQTVEIRDAVLYVDGLPVREPYVDLATIDGLYFGPSAVGPDAFFVLGDAREVSVDSRAYGPIDRSAVRGRVLVRLWSACPD